MTEGNPQVAIIMGSDSDYQIMQGAIEALESFGISCEAKVVSAHRTPDYMAEFAKAAAPRGIQVIIAGAGGAAHLPGMVAAHTPLPVIGVPVPHGPLTGLDALYSIVQMPKGVPVATVAIGNSFNAGLLAAKIIAYGGQKPNEDLIAKLEAYMDQIRAESLAKTI